MERNKAEMKKVVKAVIPVAGFGTRFLPYTKAVPKMMLPIIDKPVLQVIVEEAAASGIEEILFIVGYRSEIIKDYFAENVELKSRLADKNASDSVSGVEKLCNRVKFYFTEQKEQLGTAHAISLAEQFVNGQPFLLMFGDDLMYTEGETVSSQLISAYCHTGKTVLGCKRVSEADIVKYASCEYDGNDGRVYNLTKIIEKPAENEVKSTLAPLGRYVCTPDIFDYIRKIGKGKNGEYQITDAFDLQAADSRVVAYEFEGSRYDTGDKLGYLKAVVDYALKDEKLGEDFLEFLKSTVSEKN